ncbi:NUDIX hydrolase [soil metagenome]
MDKTVEKLYGNRVRAKVCGLCWKGDKLLLVNHRGLYDHDFWAVPGGGIEFGQTAQENLEREYREETGLMVKVDAFQFVCEYISGPLHAIELFFAVTVIDGKLLTGEDPEMSGNEQIITDVRFLSVTEINELPEINKHGLFRFAKSAEKISGLKGYLKI